MHTRRLNRIARYLGSAGLYKEAYQMRKVAESEEEREELDLAQQGLETNNEFEDLFPSSPDDEDMDDMDEDMDEDDSDSALSEYLDEEDMEPAGEERFDDDEFDLDSLLSSLPHDEDDEEESDEDMFDDEDEEPLSDEDQDLYDMMMGDPDRLMKHFPRK